MPVCWPSYPEIVHPVKRRRKRTAADRRKARAQRQARKRSR